MKIILSFEQEPFRFLSNFYPSVVRYRGIRFPTVEHAYQAAKTNSENKARQIARAPTPGKAKRMGRELKLRPNWEEIKVGVMLKLLRRKFRDETLREALLATEEAILVEGNHWGDVFWGQSVKAPRPDLPTELNMLGTLLMIVRQELGGGFQ